MGIKGLIKFLARFNRYGRPIVRQEPITVLANRTLAVDISTLMYSHMNTALARLLRVTNLATTPLNYDDIKQSWLDSILSRLLVYLRMGCKMVIVFDGQASHMKDITRQDRRDKRKKLSAEIETLTKEFINTRPLDRTPEMADELRNKMKNQIDIPDSYVKELKELLQLSGMSVIQAIGEAERTCSTLAIEGIVDAVISTDSDCLTHGCPRLISKILDNGMIETIILSDVLEVLNLTLRQFQELCILSQCDYNSGVQGCPYLLNMITADGTVESHRLDKLSKVPDLNPNKYGSIWLTTKCNPSQGYPLQLDYGNITIDDIVTTVSQILGPAYKKRVSGCTIVSLYPLYYKCQSYQSLLATNNPIHGQKGHYDYSELYMEECLELFKLLPSEELMTELYSLPSFSVKDGLQELLQSYNLGNHYYNICNTYRLNPNSPYYITQHQLSQIQDQVTDFGNL